MNTLDLFEREVLRTLSPYAQITWEEFYNFFPAIKSDGDFPKEFGKILRKLLEQQLIQSSKLTFVPRYWRLTSSGRHLVEKSTLEKTGTEWESYEA